MGEMKIAYLDGMGDSGFGAAKVHTNVRAGLLQQCPNLGQFLKNLKFNLAMEGAMMAPVLKDGADPKATALAWLKANPDAVRAFLADYVAVTRYYLANTAQAKADLHKAGYVRTPLEIYQKNTDWKRAPDGRVNVESLKKLSTFMLEKLKWLDKPVNVDAMVDQGFLPR